MTIQKNCASELQNIGSLACTKNNPFLDAVSVFFVATDFEFTDGTDFASQATWLAAIRSKKIIPLHEVVEISDDSEDTRYYESPGGVRIPRKLGKYRHNFMFNLPLEVHKALQSFRNADLGLIILDDAGNVSGYSPDGTKVKGIDIGMLNPEKMTYAGQDDTPAWTPVVIDQKDSKQWNEKGVFINPTWDPGQLEPVSDVELSVVSSTATELVLRVAYNAGLADDGSADLVGVSGIDETDFVFTTTSPDAGMVDNGDGTYKFTGVGMVTGSFDLKAPSAQSSTGSPIESTGPATITI